MGLEKKYLAEPSTKSVTSSGYEPLCMGRGGGGGGGGEREREREIGDSKC